VSLPDIMLDAMVAHPGAAIAAAVAAVNDLIAPQLKLSYSPQQPADAVSATVHAEGELHGHLSLAIANADDEYSARQFLERAVHVFSKLATLEDRHAKLTKLATTDQLTGVANRRFFEHFLAKLLDKAKVKRFPVSLFLFDIDNFKKYNDEYGHAVGDEILKETAALMRRCCRKHDLVARIGGDEFAVVFWEKEGPRQPKEGVTTDVPPTRAEEPVQVLRRFQKMISSSEWAGLGPSGRGTLTISGGLANYPWDGRSVEELNEAADRALTFGAKKSGKNSIHLVGGESQSLE
jgi:PleD family two-component response regulator